MVSADSPQQIAALVDAADQAVARRVLAGLLGATPPPDGRPWSEHPIRAVAAFVLLRAGHFEPAVGMAAGALAADRGDALSARIVEAGRQQLFSHAVQALYKKRPDLARENLETATRLLGGSADLAAERALAELMAYAAAVPAARAPSGPPVGRPTVINFAAWGERFVDASLRLFLPCCLAPGNVPRLAESGPVFMHIHTRAEDIERFRAHDTVRELGRHAKFEFTAFPESLLAAQRAVGPFWNRMLIATMAYDGLMFARGLGADFVPMSADVFVSNNCFAAAKRILLSGYEAIVGAPIRATVPDIWTLLERQGYRPGTCLDLPADILYRASLQAVHPFIRESFMCRPPQRIATDPVQFYFPTPRGFVARGFHLHAFMLSTRRLPADLVCDMHTVDTRLLSDLLDGLGRSAACYVHDHPPGEMYYFGVDESGGATAFGNAEVSPAGAAGAAAGWISRYEDLDHFLWAIGRRFEYEVPPEIAFPIPPGCRAEDESVAEIVTALKARRMKIFEGLQRYRR